MRTNLDVHTNKQNHTHTRIQHDALTHTSHATTTNKWPGGMCSRACQTFARHIHARNLFTHTHKEGKVKKKPHTHTHTKTLDTYTYKKQTLPDGSYDTKANTRKNTHTHTSQKLRRRIAVRLDTHKHTHAHIETNTQT
eukprot:GDKI01046837.1.p3 GENE.GDKI01046837.1~~GDKI01046837.1.p3  ORF type:complete len:138 (-),score=48.25 GDKI01046837.1:696-1109(-)